MKKVFTALVVVFVLFAPAASVHAASLPLLDPDFTIVPKACLSTCPCGIGAAIIAVQNIMNVMVSVAVIAMTLIIAYAGFMFIASAANPESRSKARSMLINAFIGLFITLAGWLIVDFIMKNLYNPDSEFGPWNSILLVGDAKKCIEPVDITQIEGLPTLLKSIEGTAVGTSGATGSGAPSIAVGGGQNCPAADPAGMRSFPTSVTSGGPEKATPTTVQNFLAMREAALKDGIDLKVQDGYRSETEQVSLWNQRGKIGQVAKPCTVPGGNGSNHNSGTAIDIVIPGCHKTGNCSSSRAYQWLKNNGGKYTFYNNLPGTDNIHWSPSGR